MFNNRLLLLFLFFIDTVLIVLAIHLGRSIEIDPLKFFDEGGFITWFSTLKLLSIAVLSFMILFFRCQGQKGNCWEYPSLIWILIGAGFIFLSGDELFELHEKTDEMIHSLLHIKETRLSDRIDDLLVVIYLMIGAAFFYRYRQELLKYMNLYPFIIAGFAISTLMVFLDFYTNLTPGEWISPTIYRLSIAEDTLKIYAESIFFMAFWSAMQKARNQKEAARFLEKNGS